jgi:hypothetical protein
MPFHIPPRLIPNAPAYANPAPEYLRHLLATAGLTQAEAAQKIGVSTRIMRQYLAPDTAATAVRASYPVQFALEALALDALRRSRRKVSRPR